jgi:hypothetical protein
MISMLSFHCIKLSAPAEEAVSSVQQNIHKNVGITTIQNQFTN